MLRQGHSGGESLSTNCCRQYHRHKAGKQALRGGVMGGGKHSEIFGKITTLSTECLTIYIYNIYMLFITKNKY